MLSHGKVKAHGLRAGDKRAGTHKGLQPQALRSLPAFAMETSVRQPAVATYPTPSAVSPTATMATSAPLAVATAWATPEVSTDCTATPGAQVTLNFPPEAWAALRTCAQEKHQEAGTLGTHTGRLTVLRHRAHADTRCSFSD